MKIRPLRETDLADIVRVEQRSMAAPWSEKQLREEWRAANGAAWVAAQDDRLLGYAFFRTCPPECELVRMAVERRRWRTGVGTMLLDHAIRLLAAAGYTACWLEVRATNDAARRLYEKTGFMVTGRRQRYYSQPEEDAILMGATWPTTI